MRPGLLKYSQARSTVFSTLEIALLANFVGKLPLTSALAVMVKFVWS